MREVVKSPIAGMGTELKCPTCGKHFFPTERWAYKDRDGDPVCSYSCTHPKKKIEKLPNAIFTIGLPYAVVQDRDTIKEAVSRAGFPSVSKWAESKVKELYEQTGLVSKL